MEGINIWSGSDIGLGAALTNPTELAFLKGKLKNHYPVIFNNQTFVDAEAVYQKFKSDQALENFELMTAILVAKLEQYPRLFGAIERNGGVTWLEKCSHIVGAKNRYWEGKGRSSKFISCLISAYEILVIDF